MRRFVVSPLHSSAVGLWLEFRGPALCRMGSLSLEYLELTRIWTS